MENTQEISEGGWRLVLSPHTQHFFWVTHDVGPPGQHIPNHKGHHPAAMITSCARIMAVATIATTRCGSFLYGGSRFARAGARGGKQFAALHLSSTQVEHSSSSTAVSRGNADDASLDSSLISTNPGLVVEHMKARRMGEDSIEAVNRIGGKRAAVRAIRRNMCAFHRSWCSRFHDIIDATIDIRFTISVFAAIHFSSIHRCKSVISSRAHGLPARVHHD